MQTYTFIDPKDPANLAYWEKLWSIPAIEIQIESGYSGSNPDIVKKNLDAKRSDRKKAESLL